MATEIKNVDELTEPIIRRKTLSASNEGDMMTMIDFGAYGSFATDEPIAQGGTGEGPSPLQTVLGALCGCEAVTFRRAADDFAFSYEGIEFEAEFTIDIRGRMGKQDVRPHFQTIRLQATVTTDESENRLGEVVEETEARCPVFNLVSDAGVKTDMVWIRRPATQRGRA
jgi:uncharacterized OsmC-like protein